MGRMRIFAAFCIVLCVAGMACAETVIYDGNNIAPFKDRTKDDAVAKYMEARDAESTYMDNSPSTWYEIPASLESPYEAGVLTQDTINTMLAMTNFYRWLAGWKPITSVHSNNSYLQVGALVRNFDFAHAVSDDKKPSDMPQELWDEGAAVWHNILSLGATPRESITNWLNEGYSLSSGTWNTTGHRTALIGGAFIEFGYSGSVAIGLNTDEYTGFEGVFAAFPSPGPMPRRKIEPWSSVWHIQLNRNFLSANDALCVKVTNLSTGTSYECTRENGKIGTTGEYFITFVQPSEYAPDRFYSGDYRVDVTGLTDTETGNDSQLTYTVNFTEFPPEIDTGGEITMTVGIHYSHFLYATGSAVTWTLTEGSLPPGISIESNDYGSNYLGGIPTAEGTYSFTLTASNEYGSDSAPFTITVKTIKPTITTESLTDASADVSYSASISASGSKPITFAVTEGNLPEGLTLSENGKISGTPTQAGYFAFTVTASNTAGTDSRRYTLTVSRMKPMIKTESFSDFEVMSNISYEYKLSITGSEPITITLKSGKLPDGLALSADGTISGRPTKAGEFTFTLRAENDAGYDEKQYTVKAVTVKPEMWEHTFSALMTGKSARILLRADGSKPITWSISAGKLPDGIILTSDDILPGAGLLSGIPTTPGKFTFTVRASNEAGYDEKDYTLEVTGTAIPDPTPTPIVSPDPTPIISQDPTPTPTPTPIISQDPTPTPTPTPTISQDPTPTPTPTPIISQDPTPTRDSEANKIRALMGRSESVPFTRITGRTEQYGYYDDSIVAVLEGMNVAETGIYFIQNIALRIRVPAGSYLVWHNDTAYGTLLGAADNECVFLDDYSNEITMPTASDMYHVSAAVYLEGGRTYSPYITADYRTNTNTEPKQGESEGGGGGCGGFISATALAVLLLWRKR